ncbi:hypothetical protein [Streptomyces sp. NPDC059176]
MHGAQCGLAGGGRGEGEVRQRRGRVAEVVESDDDLSTVPLAAE